MHAGPSRKWNIVGPQIHLQSAAIKGQYFPYFTEILGLKLKVYRE